MSTIPVRDFEHYFGVDVAEDGALVVAERHQGRPAQAPARYPAGAAGIAALRRDIAGSAAHPHVCIRSHGAVALSLAAALMALPGSEVTLVAPRAIEVSGRTGRDTPPANPEERAARLARLAERLF